MAYLPWLHFAVSAKPIMPALTSRLRWSLTSEEKEPA
jgi:hypothetical protein